MTQILSSLLCSHRDDIIRRWTALVSGTLHPSGMPRLELVDHLPDFLQEVSESLRLSESPEGSRTAMEHGVQRLNLGFSLDCVVREYGALRDAIVAEAASAGVIITPTEREILFDSVITGIAEAVSEYQRQRDAELQRQMSEHFAFIAHELRNPLGTARMAFSMIEKPTASQGARLHKVLDSALTRTYELIDRSLRLAQVGASINVHRTDVSLRAILAEAELAATAEAEAKNIQLSIHLETDVTVSVDVRLIHSALTNLIRNAVKFTCDGGRVQVRAQVGSTGALVVEVEDRCGGLPPGDVEKAFAPFVQMGADRSGFGLGLAIAKQAAEAHEGTIRIQNLPGKGCIFALELPSTVTSSA